MQRVTRLTTFLKDVSIARTQLKYTRSARAISSAVPRCYSCLLSNNRIEVTKKRNGHRSFPQHIRWYSSDLPEHRVVTIPNLSPTMETGTIVSWLKKEGEAVAEGDAIAEIETDKSTMTLDSSEDGFIAKILMAEGTKDIPIGKPIYVMVEEEADISQFASFSPPDDDEVAPAAADAPAAPSAPSPPPAPPAAKPLPTPPATPAPAAAPAPAPAPTPTAPSGRVIASPLAKKLAAEKGIDLSSVTPSTPGARIVADDVMNALVAPGAPPAVAPAAIPGATYTDVQLSSMRKTIAKRLTESKQSVPHYYLTADVLMDSTLSLRSELNDTLSQENLKLSVNDFVVKAAALACSKVPAANSAWMETSIREYHTVDMCIAVATDGGLITPIVSSAEKKGLVSINTEVAALAAKAREGRLQPHEFQGGTFTISNLGMYGIKSFTAIINPPQACILAVGSTRKELVADSDSEQGYREASVMSVTLSCDHRVVDGAVGAQWLQEFKKLLESPNRMLL